MFKNKKIFVLGMGKSGVSVARLLAKENHVLITDIKCDDLELIKELEGLGVNVIITKKQNEIWFLIQLVGEGTRHLAQAKKGDLINERVRKLRDLPA